MHGSVETNLPLELQQHLREIGVLKAEKPKEVKDLRDHVAWVPTYDGEEPPF